MMNRNSTISLTKITAFLVALTLILSISVPLAFGAQSSGQTNVRSSYLIGFEETAPRGTVRGLIEAFGGEIYAEFQIVDAFAAQLLPQQAAALARNPHIKYVEPDGIAHALAQVAPWGIDKVLGGASSREATWVKSTGASIGVAVLDTGIGPHEDLTVVGGVRFYLQAFRLRQDNNYQDGNGHGTHVAGTIAALNNTVGVVGVAPAASLYAVKVLGDTGSGSISAIVAGIEWSYNRFPTIKIINMSLGSSTYSQTLEEACNAAYAQGMLVVSSAGNTGTVAGTENNVGYPARYASVIAVAASDVDNKRASFSSTGPAVELIAPGVSVMSTVPGGYAAYNGTSMASPHVAGVAALVWGAKTNLSNSELRTLLQDSAFDLGLSSEHQGHGLVRGDLAVAQLSGGTTVPVTGVTIDQASPESVEVGKTLQLSATISPADATNKGVTWSSDNTSVATVGSSTGLVTGKIAGKAVITVTTTDGGFTASITVSVAEPTLVQPVISTVTITSPPAGAYYKWNALVSITVHVRDTNNALLPNANVTVEIVEVNNTYTGTTDSTGNFTASYRIPNRLAPGTFTVSASATYGGSALVAAEPRYFIVTGK